MSSTRQDAWSQDEDLLLAEVVLRHIREGGTQLQAFEEVGKQLNRTAAACGFRWNSYVRKQYKSGIELAKKQRKEMKKNPQAAEREQELRAVPEERQEKRNENAIQAINRTIEFDELVGFLKDLYDNAQKPQLTEDPYDKKRFQELEKQMYYLAAENEKLIKELNTLEQDYKALVEIMESARKLVGLKDGSRHKNLNFTVNPEIKPQKVEK
ncbi:MULTISPECIES: RsfA family transcriptional regulator [unclassified Cytobacillus]|uniref:RsfA family transcriptional regulator n=1 Tax=unclassified Cytobacillus TaxID=2675268 RepID=UPI00203AF42C|nr:RsfA family transcriptional regulator [Cytobacillus sp. AMY 15.2]MCM3089477.1 RsfA family transcriptional regulator [Cytobacillus sp. AMY 15.2]